MNYAEACIEYERRGRYHVSGDHERRMWRLCSVALVSERDGTFSVRDPLGSEFDQSSAIRWRYSNSIRVGRQEWDHMGELTQRIRCGGPVESTAAECGVQAS